MNNARPHLRKPMQSRANHKITSIQMKGHPMIPTVQQQCSRRQPDVRDQMFGGSSTRRMTPHTQLLMLHIDVPVCAIRLMLHIHVPVCAIQTTLDTAQFLLTNRYLSRCCLYPMLNNFYHQLQ